MKFKSNRVIEFYFILLLYLNATSYLTLVKRSQLHATWYLNVLFNNLDKGPIWYNVFWDQIDTSRKVRRPHDQLTLRNNQDITKTTLCSIHESLHEICTQVWVTDPRKSSVYNPKHVYKNDFCPCPVYIAHLFQIGVIKKGNKKFSWSCWFTQWICKELFLSTAFIPGK